MGADRRRASQVRDYFGNLWIGNTFSELGAKVATANHHAGLVAGYLEGRLLSKNQHAIFWHDLGHRMGDQSYRGPLDRWGERDWQDWYTDVAAVFRRDHLVR